MLMELKQRIRGVRQGPDGVISENYNAGGQAAHS